MNLAKNGKYKPIVLTLDDGKKVEITGKIDRIDIAKTENGNYVRIIDYKSSEKDIDLNDVYAGLQIQLITYLDAVCKAEDFIPAGVLYFNLLEQIVSAKTKLDDTTIQEKIKEGFQMHGLILADIKVIKMQDINLEKGQSKIIPAYIDSKGNIGSRTNGVTREQFEDLQKYMYKTIKDISKEILSGKIELKPYYKNGKTPCSYCPYKSVCGFNAGFCNNKYNYIKHQSNEKILGKIHDSQ